MATQVICIYQGSFKLCCVYTSDQAVQNVTVAGDGSGQIGKFLLNPYVSPSMHTKTS
jgi:hypothetical protein